MKKLSTLLTVLVCFILLSTSAWSATWIVNNLGGGDFTTIQAAVTAAAGNDIIYVEGTGTSYNENVNIPAGKNQLKIIGSDIGSGLPVMNGAAVANPRVAFRVNSDNVTISYMVIQNYNYGGATNVSFGSAQRGVGIESLIASSGHTFTNNTINNCNWGIYVREGNSINVSDNTITNTVRTTQALAINAGGQAIAFVSSGVSMDQNTIVGNTISNAAFYGILFGRTLAGGAPVGGDNVVINENEISNCGLGNNGFAIYVNNIKADDALRIEDNILDGNNAGMRFDQTIANANTDFNVYNNIFDNTVSPTEVQTSSLFVGGTLYDIMFNNGNRFDEGTPTTTPGAVAALDINDTEVVSTGTNRFIRNTFAAAIVDGEGYLSAAAAATNVKVYAMAGFYPNEVAAVTSNPTNLQNMLITGEVNGGNLAKAQGNAVGSTIFDVAYLTNLTVTFANIDVELNSALTQTGIRTLSSFTTVLGCNFTTLGTTNPGRAVMVESPNLNQQSDFFFEGNTLFGYFMIGVGIDQDDFIITCNEFGSTYLTGDGIFVYDFNGDGNDIIDGRIIRNTSGDIAPSIAWNIRVQYPTATSGGLKIGEPDAGNFFNSGQTAIFVVQLNDNQVAVNYNSFLEDSYTAWINNVNAFDLNAGWNYWEILGVAPFTEISSMIIGTGAADVFFLPIFTDGTDIDASCGFQADLTSIWTPVYTAVDETDPLTDPDALFFWTIEDALADPNTGIGSGGAPERYAVLLYNHGTLLENNPLNVYYPVWIGGAPAQPANSDTDPDPSFWTVEADNNALPLFWLTVPGTASNPITFDNISLLPYYASNSSDNIAIYADMAGAVDFEYLNVTNCYFDLSNQNSSYGILIDDLMTTGISDIFIYNNHFRYYDDNYPYINAPIQLTNTRIWNNYFDWDENTGSSPIASVYVDDGADNLSILGNKFGAPVFLLSENNDLSNIQIGDVGTEPTYGFLQGNEFNNPDVSGMFYGLAIIKDLGGGVVASNDINIVQNDFNDLQYGIYIASDPADINLNNIFVNNNWFREIGASSIELDDQLNPPFTGLLDATNNYWNTDDGPLAMRSAPSWHDDFGVQPIIANSYNYDVNNNASPVGVLYQADFIQFVEWWQNFQYNAGPGSFTGDEFAPIYDDNGDVWASLVFALGETGGTELYIAPADYVEDNTIQQPMNPFAISIYGDVNGGTYFRPNRLNSNGSYSAEYMFYFSGDVDINMYHLHLNDFRPLETPQDQDVEAAIFVDGNDPLATSFVNFYNGSINEISGTNPTSGTGIYAVDNAEVRVENSEFVENDYAAIWLEEVTPGETPTGTILNNVIYGAGETNFGINLIGETYATIQYNTIFDVTGASAGIFSSGIGAGSLNIEFNQIYGNTHGIELGVAGAGDDYSAAVIRNNAIYNNVTAGLIYFPNVNSTVTAEDNWWGNDAGPASEGFVFGVGSSEWNGFFDNGITQGNPVVDGNASSTIDFLPYRRTLVSPFISMIAGPRFAPIIRTNSANIPQSFHASTAAASNSVSNPNEKIYFYGGNYADLFWTFVADVDFIGKRRMAAYNASWLINPQGTTQNAWDGSIAKGAHPVADGPRFIAHKFGPPFDVMNALIVAADITVQGFIFDAAPTVAGVSGPYTADQDQNMILGFSNNNTINHNTFYGEVSDVNVDIFGGIVSGTDITNNILFSDVASAVNPFSVRAETFTGFLIYDLYIAQNVVSRGQMSINAADGDITDMTVEFNEFYNTLQSITVEGTGPGLGFGQLENIQIRNNYFADNPGEDQYALGIPNGTPDNAVVNSWTQDIVFTENYIGVDPLDVANTQPAVGFQDPTPAATYTSAISATCNWWGSANGPTYALNPGGDGATVSDRVYMAPWLTGNTNLASFGFLPGDACDGGIRVWVNNTNIPTDQFIIFPGLQMAVDDPNVVNTTYEYIFVHDDYTTGNTPGFLDESVSIANWNTASTWFLSSESGTAEIGLSGNFALAGAGFPYNLVMQSPMRVQGSLILDNIGCEGWLFLGNNDFTVEGHITEGYFINIFQSCQVATNGLGYLVKENVVTGGINNFPIIGNFASTGTPAQFVVNSGGFTAAQNNILKVRSLGTDPVTFKGMGQNGFDINNVWSIDFTNNAGTNPNFAMQLRVYDNSMNDANFDNITSYAAYWDMNLPGATQWATKKSTSSWNGTDGVQVVNLDLITGPSDWAIFSGPTSFALSNEPNQARNIMWYTTTDRDIHFKWTRNDANAQYYAILAREGDMIAPPSSFTPTPISVYVPYTCPPMPNGPWTCNPGYLNFSDGWLNTVDPNFDWASSLFHGDQVPNGARVIKIGKYGPGAIFDAYVNNLNQGTFYEFFVANFNYGDGTAAVADLVSGTDGMANYNLNPGTVNNPRVRKTMPAVYMTIDFSNGFATNAANQPNRVWAYTNSDGVYNPMDIYNNIVKNNGVLGSYVVENTFNGDDLLGGHVAVVCDGLPPANVWSANNIRLHFKNYGRYTGGGWIIKYSENNDTKTFTTPSINAFTDRTRSINTDYYLVSAYDGDGKVAYKYDNAQTIRFQVDNPSVVTLTETPVVMPTCEGNTTTLVSAPTSYPNASFDRWQYDNGGGWTDVVGGVLPGGSTLTAGPTTTITLNYGDNGTQIRAVYISNSICDLGLDIPTNAITLQIYDATLTGTTPTPTAPYLCDDAGSVTFTTTDGAPLTPPNNLVFLGWEISDDNGSTWSPLITGAGSYVNATISAVTGVGGTTGTITVTAAPLTDIDDYEFRGVWQNGDCAPVETTPAVLNVIVKPVVTGPTTPSAVCIGQPINLTSSAAAPIAPTTQTIQWQIGTSSSGPWTNLVNGVAANGTIAGANAANLTLTPSTLGWNGQWVRVVYTNSEGGTDCVTESAAVELEVLPTPEFSPIADQTVCQTTNLVVTAVDANPVSWSGNVEWYYNTTASMTGATQMLNGNSYNGSLVNISGASDATITVNAVTLAWDGLYILVYNDNGSCDAFEAFQVNVDELPVVTTDPVDDAVCAGGTLTYTADFTPTTASVTWEYSTNNGISWNPVPASFTGDAFNTTTVTTISGSTQLDVANTNIAIHNWDVRVALDNGVCATVYSASANMGIFTVPTVPAPIGAQNILSHKFDVTYPADANALTWDIQVADDAGFTNIVYSTTGAGPSPFTGMPNCALDPASTYYFRVRAVNACGASAWSTPSNLVTLDPTVVSMAWQGGFSGDFGTGELGNPSSPETLRLTYYQLDAPINITVPADFQIFLGGNWVNGTQNLGLTLYLGTAGTPLTADFLVRFNPTVCGNINTNITIASTEVCVGNTSFGNTSVVAKGFGKVPQPTIQASNVIFTANNANDFTFTWTNGNGNGRLVTIVEDGASVWTPTDFVDYSSIQSLTIDDGNDVATGNWVVYAGSGSGPLTVDGLTAGVVYHAYVFEFNECASGTEDYLLPGATGQVLQLAFYTDEPTAPVNGIPNQTSGVAFRQSDDLTALAIEVLLVDRAGDPIANPFSSFGVSIGGNPALGTVTVNSGSTTMANGASSTAGTPMSITWTYPNGILNANLTATTAQAGVLPGASNDFVLNVAPPTSQAKIILWVGVPCINNTTFQWTNGDGASRLVVGRDGSLPELPTDLTDYSGIANTDFSLAGTYGTATKVLAVITGSGNSVTISGLTLNQTYYFRVFEFNGTGGLQRYLTSNASFNPRSRKITCLEGNNLFDLVVENFNVVSGKGKGIVSWKTEYEQNIAGFEVSRIDLTDGSSLNPTLVGTYMNADELVAVGNTSTGKAYKYTDNTVTLEVGRTYLYQLTAVAYDGTRIDVAEAEITISDDIIAGPTEFSVTPVQVINNEAKFRVNTNTTQDVTIELYDVIGNRIAVIANGVVLNLGSNEFSYPVDKLVNGTYIISVNGRDINAIQKFQIAR